MDGLDCSPLNPQAHEVAAAEPARALCACVCVCVCLYVCVRVCVRARVLMCGMRVSVRARAGMFVSASVGKSERTHT